VTEPHEALVAILRDGRLLLVHRVPDDGGYWHLVGGGIERGESPAVAAAREVAEEVALAVPLDPLDVTYAYERDGLTIVVECFRAAAPAGWEPRLNEEHDDYRWCDAAEADALLRWPEPRELAARLLR
jgi:dATP pyrophosphohydrolase